MGGPKLNYVANCRLTSVAPGVPRVGPPECNDWLRSPDVTCVCGTIQKTTPEAGVTLSGVQPLLSRRSVNRLLRPTSKPAVVMPLDKGCNCGNVGW